MTDIPGYQAFTKTEQIDEGLSRDQKYRVETADGRRLLLRVSNIAEYDRIKAKFDRMRRMDAEDIPMSRPVDFGVCDDGKKVYQLTTWCDGDNLEKALPSLTESEQYALGKKAGGILRRIHSVPVAPEDISGEDWHKHYSDFMDESIKEYIELNIPVDGSETILNYFNSHRYLLKTRPQCYLHNDYHAGNMILSPGNDLYIVDWEILLYNNYGDPWMEVSLRETPCFSKGLIHGYFGGEPPEEYWTLLAFYMSIASLSAIPWAHYAYPDWLESVKEHVSEVLGWFDGMKNVVPTWYRDVYLKT